MDREMSTIDREQPQDLPIAFLSKKELTVQLGSPTDDGPPRDSPLKSEKEYNYQDVAAGGCCGGRVAKIRGSLGETKLLVHILVATFAIASWADLNAMWSELPQLTIFAPEQWTLPSYITIISQVANIGPIAFVIVAYLLPNTKPKLETWVSFVIILISMTAALLMAFFWNHTSHIFGEEHSTALLALNFMLALGDCTSSVSFYAFMSLLKPQYMASLLLGEGLSGFLPGMLALIQGAGEIVCVNGSSTNTSFDPTTNTTTNKTSYFEYPMYEEPLFSVETYFLIISVIIFLSAAAFLALIQLDYCRSEFVSSPFTSPTESERRASYGSTSDVETHGRDMIDRGHDGPYSNGDVKNDEYGNGAATTTVSTKYTSSNGPNTLRSRLQNLVQLENLSTSKFVILLLVVFVINMTITTFLPTVQIYTVLPYGLEYYHLTTSLGQVANPTACLLAVFLMAESTLVICVVTVAGQGIVAYLIYLAAMSPEPPMYDQSGGGEISVLSWILVTMLLVYAKVCVAGVLRKFGGRSALVWAGVVTQIGTAVGAVVGFVLVNEYHLFKDAPYC